LSSRSPAEANIGEGRQHSQTTMQIL